MVQRVFVDANVLYSRTLRDWTFLLRNSAEGMFQLHSTRDAICEALAKYRKNNSNAPGHQVANIEETITSSLDELVREFPGNIAFDGRDQNDYHIHAAAVSSQADIILTCNEATDITTTPDEQNYEIFHPDDFFLLVADSRPQCVKQVTRCQHEYWKDKQNYLQLDEALRKSYCPMFAKRVRQALQEIARE
ncbi:PIN domain-containing protein [Nesterenkonia sp. K-15-9-6]|uniref:PIN domain-containing protein n=1 Tax=Nesterenkonia sp. K-15-9-6 TaxID=3093918 RepID=UPI004044E2CD